MVARSGVLPYTYIDIPFTFTGRGSGAPGGLDWSGQEPPIGQVSGFFYEQAMFTHLAEIRKYGPPNESHNFWIYKGASTTTTAKEPVFDPSPTGALLTPSGNMYIINTIEDLRGSLDLIFRKVSTDSPYSSGVIKSDYFQTSFPNTPRGQAGQFEFNLESDALEFSPTTGELGSSGLIDTRTIEEVTYRPYTRFASRSTYLINSLNIETAPFLPGHIGSAGDLPAVTIDESTLFNGDVDLIGEPQTAGFNPNVVPSGFIRVVGDVFTTTSQLRIVDETRNPFNCSAVTDRWIGEQATRNKTEVPGSQVTTPGMGFFTTATQSLPHGVHQAIVSTSGAGYGDPSGLISIFPIASGYNTTGFIGEYIGTTSNSLFGILRNTTDGIPSNGNALNAAFAGTTIERSQGIHVCDRVFGARNSSGIVSVSPFNGVATFFNVKENVNNGGTGEQTSAWFSKVGPPTWVWRQVYDEEPAFWRNTQAMIQPEGSDTAYSFVEQFWSFRSYSTQAVTGPPTGAPQQAGTINSTRGLGQTDTYQFHKINLASKEITMVKTGYGHISHINDYSLNGLAWSRDYGWFGVGGKSSNNHKFESCRLTSPDGGSFTASSAGGLSLTQPIGIGSKSFAKLSDDIALNIRRWWELRLGSSDGYSTVLVKAYSLVVAGDLPFTASDITLVGIRGHTIFVGLNDEGVTPGDWVVIETNNVGRVLCRVELDTTAGEIQIQEFLYILDNTSNSPEVFMPIN